VAVEDETILEVEEKVLPAALDALEHQTVDGGRRESIGPTAAGSTDRDWSAGQRGVHPPSDTEDRVPLRH
jgi:hypothetical protein